MKSTSLMFLFLVKIIIAAVVLSSCKKEKIFTSVSSAPVSLIQTLKNGLQYSIFYEGLRRTGLDKMLNGSSSFTLLVPDNNAFANVGLMSPSSLNSIADTTLQKILMYHILPGRIYYSDVPQSIDNPYKSVSGLTLYFSKPILWDTTNADRVNFGPGLNLPPLQVNGDLLYPGGKTSYPKDIVASDGVIQILNAPLKLPTGTVQDFLLADTNFRYFVQGLKQFGLFDQLRGAGPFTIFAPTNAAFKASKIQFDTLLRYTPSKYTDNLFGVYINSPNRMFSTDIYDAAQEYGTPAALSTHLLPVGYIFSNYGIVTIIASSPPSNSFQIVDFTNSSNPLDYIQGVGSPYSTLGKFANFISYDNIEFNGVVHTIDQLIVTPSKALIK